jgi:hypothetical protein
MHLTYLAAPYSHRDPEVVEARVVHIARAAAWLLENTGKNVFSPISHSHPLHKLAGMKGDWNFWCKIDTDWLERSDDVVILTLPGWRESVGVTEETKIATRLFLPIQYLNASATGDFSLSTFVEEEVEYAD